MSSYRYKPSKPVAIFGLVAGIAMIVLVLTTFQHGNPAFLVVWCVVALVVAAERCCLALCVLVFVFDEPPQPAIATATATVVTSTRFIAPPSVA